MSPRVRAAQDRQWQNFGDIWGAAILVPQRAGGRCDGSGTSAAALEQPSQLTNGPAQQLGGGGALV